MSAGASRRHGVCEVPPQGGSAAPPRVQRNVSPHVSSGGHIPTVPRPHSALTVIPKVSTAPLLHLW